MIKNKGFGFLLMKVFRNRSDAFLNKAKLLILVPLLLSMYACGGSGTVDATATNSTTNTTGSTPIGGTGGGVFDGTVQVSWNPPVSYTTGTALSLSAIQSYTLRYGTQSGNYTNSIVINSPSTNAYTITGLPHGKYYLTISVKLADGSESVYSNEVTRTI